jgi:hypothetical protein
MVAGGVVLRNRLVTTVPFTADSFPPGLRKQLKLLPSGTISGRVLCHMFSHMPWFPRQPRMKLANEARNPETNLTNTEKAAKKQ